MTLRVGPDTELPVTLPKGGAAWNRLTSDKLWPIYKLRQARQLTGHAWKITSASWHPDSRVLVATDQSGNVIVWSAMEKLKLHYMNKPFLTASTFHPNPDTRVAAFGGLDNMISIYDMAPSEVGGPLAKGELPVSGDGHEGSITCLHFISSDTLVSASGDGDVRVWDVVAQQGKQVLSGHTRDAVSLSFPRDTQNEHTFASGSLDGTVRIWDLRSGRTVAIFNTSDEVSQP